LVVEVAGRRPHLTPQSFLVPLLNSQFRLLGKVAQLGYFAKFRLTSTIGLIVLTLEIYLELELHFGHRVQRKRTFVEGHCLHLIQSSLYTHLRSRVLEIGD
jgi:hypothetical protein